MMIPQGRILKKNFWCEADEQFVQKMTENFDRWIKGRFGDDYHDLNQSQEQNKHEDRIPGQDDLRKRGGCDLLNETKDLKIIDSIEGANNCTTIKKSSAHITNILIPKIFHFIWLGSELPVVCSDFIDTWRRYHPNWIFNIWLDKGDQNYHELT